eukprot:1151155-Pelagomonas_calceolata.AAC.1
MPSNSRGLENLSIETMHHLCRADRMWGGVISAWLDSSMDACPSGCFKGFEQGLESVCSEHANALAIGIIYNDCKHERIQGWLPMAFAHHSKGEFSAYVASLTNRHLAFELKILFPPPVDTIVQKFSLVWLQAPFCFS